MGLQDNEIILEIRNISKSFGAANALDDVSLALHKGEVMALAGHNGAGKSVLVKTLAGFYEPDDGEIYFHGKKVEMHSPRQAQEYGYDIVPQELTVAKQMSVADNIFIGREEFSGKAGMVRGRHIHIKANQLLKEYFDVEIDPRQQVGSLDTITQRLIQVVRCLHAGAKVIVFDETTAGLARHEREILFEHIKKLAAKGLGIIFISHIISEMTTICDSIAVLRGGRMIGKKEMKDTNAQEIIEMIVGEKMMEEHYQKSIISDEVLLSVSGLQSKNKWIRDVSFTLRKGEVIGIYGLRDQGQTHLMELLFGARSKGAGTISIKGEAVNINNPEAALVHKLSYLPNRGVKTNFGQKSIIDNVVVQSSNYIDKGGWVKKAQEKDIAQEMADRFKVLGYSSLGSPLASLSGGNMQKVLFARCALLDPEIMIFMEPTEGIDIGAKHEIKEMMISLAGEGRGILLVTSEIDDIISLCHKVMIVRKNSIRNIMDATEENRTKIIYESTQ